MNILLVDDDQHSRLSISSFLKEMGHHVIECANGEEALAIFHTLDFPLVLSDVRMPKMTGIELLRSIAELKDSRGTDVVLFTGYRDMDSAIEALRAGAYDYLLKPIQVEELYAVVERVAEHQALRRENKRLVERFDDEVRAATEEAKQELKRLRKMAIQYAGLPEIAIYSENMRQLVEKAQKYHGDRSIPVLIQGETGTGKEVIARIIHFGEGAEQAPFVDINCAALTPSLFESELFGYEPGSFTGGLNRGQKGKLDIAQGGTLFLDEVAEIPMELQAKLLRVIQEKEFYRVGGLKKVKTDVRIICATNVDLEQRMEQGAFRKDLYYRLKVGHLVIPPLRQRKEDILPLAEMFLTDFARQKGKRFQRIENEAANFLLSYHWPGNVRELRNTMEWVAFMYDDVEVKSFHLDIMGQGKPLVGEAVQTFDKTLDTENFTLPAKGLALDEYIDRIIQKSMEMHHGNKSVTARFLGVSRRSLCCRLDRMKKKDGFY